MPGPLPNPAARRRNAPTIPTNNLPAGGRLDDTGKAAKIPRCPYALGKAGKAWWRWAWRLPQAAAWDDGSHYALARRAQLEDEMAALDRVDTNIGEVLGLNDEQELNEQLEWILRKLQSRATGSVALMREMRELDKRFGLDPKALAELRWTIVPTADEAPKAKTAPRRLRAV
jgi:hypothetical protein